MKTMYAYRCNMIKVKIENMVIPESYIRVSVQKSEFDRVLKLLESDTIIFVLRNARYAIIDQDTILEEVI